MNNVADLNDCLYYIGMVDSLVDGNGEKSKEYGLDVIQGEVNITDSLKVAYRLSDCSDPAVDSFGVASRTHYIELKLIENGKSIKEVDILKEIGVKDKDYLKVAAPVEEKYGYIRKSKLFKKPYIVVGFGTNAKFIPEPVSAENQKLLLEYTKELIESRNKTILKKGESR